MGLHPKPIELIQFGAGRVKTAMRRVFLILGISMLISGCSFFGVRSGYEQPRYDVVEQQGSVEVRSYETRVAAEARVEADGTDDGRNRPFRLLFDYISGANQSGSKIAMTAPVESDRVSEQIAMTVPVETARSDDDGVYMRFFLPEKYDSETAPKPLDERVTIVSVPQQTVAALRFTGFGSEETVKEKQSELLASLEGTEWRAVGAPTAYFYDPPWTLPFLRRNEVVVAVSQ